MEGDVLKNKILSSMGVLKNDAITRNTQKFNLFPYKVNDKQLYT